MPLVSREAIHADLVVAARQRFGDDRVAALRLELEALATDLTRVAEAPLPDGLEPDFLESPE